MNLLALDQASKTSGFAVFKDGELIDCGTFDATDEDVGQRLVFIRDQIIKLIIGNEITDIVFEDIMMSNMSNNVATHKVLAEVLGVVHELSAERQINYQIIPATSWKFGIGFKTKKRQEQKKEAQQYVLEHYGLKVNQDTADAICIGTYYMQQQRSAF